MPKQRTPEEQREYMRAYRARKKANITLEYEGPPKNVAMVKHAIDDRDAKIAELEQDKLSLGARIYQLEDEVHRLKQELSKAKMPAVNAAAGLPTTDAIAGPQTATPRGVSSRRAVSHTGRTGVDSEGTKSEPAPGDHREVRPRSPDPSASEHDDGRPDIRPHSELPDDMRITEASRVLAELMVPMDRKTSDPDRLSKKYFARRKA